MITMKDFMECTDYRITESSPFMWDCFGPNAIGIDYWNGTYADGVNVNIVYDAKTNFVYEMQAWDYANNREYRWIHPGYIEGHAAEALRRNVDHFQSIDDRKFIDLEVVDDMLEKAYAIGHGEEYDDRVIVPLDMNDEQLLQLMKLAHEADMSLNQFVEFILRKEMKRLKAEQE